MLALCFGRDLAAIIASLAFPPVFSYLMTDV